MQGEILDDINSKKFLPLEETFLSEEIVRYSRIELDETEENRKKCLLELRNLISREKDLEFDTDENFPLRFLRARKFDTNRAFSLLKNYYSQRAKYPDLYKDFKPSTVAQVLNSNGYGSLPYRNSVGCAINLCRLGLWDTSVCGFDDLHRCAVICTEKMIENEITQICGIVFIIDLAGFSLKHLIRFTPSKIHRSIRSLQNAFPVRVKEIHIINHPKFFSIIYSAVKLVLSEKLTKRIMFHESNTESLHRYFSPSILPEEFGGELGPFDNSSFARKLLESEETFIKKQRFGFKGNTIGQ